ncbi:MAG: hypothetical protein IBJ18_00715 [Phycisphaerales bacterium]|nr:hypothetical protein [Phycisphaerales bacterium]
MISRFRPSALFARAPRSRAISPLLVLVMLTFTLLTRACAAPPNLEPFAAATHELTNTARALGPKVKSTLQMANLPTQVDRFERAWSARVKALESLNRYADDLNSIAQSAQTQPERLRRYSDSLAALASAFSPVPGNVAIFAAASSAADLLSLQAARARANSSLAHAAAAALPSVDLLTDALRDDLLDIEELIQTCHAAALLQPGATDQSVHIDAAFAHALDTIRTLREALHAWKGLHAAAVKAISSNTEPDAREVETAAARLRSLIQKAGGQ